jgi:hypothetical protein
MTVGQWIGRKLKLAPWCSLRLDSWCKGLGMTLTVVLHLNPPCASIQMYSAGGETRLVSN